MPWKWVSHYACSLFQIIKHILSGLYVYELTSTKNAWLANNLSCFIPDDRWQEELTGTSLVILMSSVAASAYMPLLLSASVLSSVARAANAGALSTNGPTLMSSGDMTHVTYTKGTVSQNCSDLFNQTSSQLLWEASSHTAITTVYSQVLIHIDEWTGAI